MNTRPKTWFRAHYLAATLLALAFTQGAARAEPASPDPCAPPAGGVFAERVRAEAARGMSSFVRFVQRTRTVYQLDAGTEIAKLDAARDAAEACASQGVALAAAKTAVANADSSTDR